jgi:hypothetical protein
MRVGVIQSAYIPWRGYFDFIRSVDLFVFYDDVQYSKGTWRNRNRVKTPRGPKWITVPVRASPSLLIEQVEIAEPPDEWRPAHRRLLEESLGEAPHFAEAMAIWETATAAGHRWLSELNVDLTLAVCRYLGITTPTRHSREFAPEGRGTARLVSLMRRLGGTTYVSGPTGKGYIEEDLFREAGLGLEYKSYDYPEYPQLWGPFESAVSILDVIANAGHGARDLIRSRTPSEVAVERLTPP